MAIPKKIHYCWFGNGEKSELVKKCIESWKKFCPDCEIIEWNETNYDVTKNDYMYQAYKTKRWGFVSDYARLDIIHNFGGIYLDTDVELIRPIDSLLQYEGFIGFELPIDKDGTKFTVNTGQGFGAVAGSSMVKKMLEEYNDLSFVNLDGTENLTACPTYNTKVLKDAGLVLDNTMQEIDNFIILPAEYFCPVNWQNKKCKITKNTYSIHHFNASWLTDKEKRKRKINRRIDNFVHLPNRILKKILGEENYSKLKNTLKR